MARGHEAPRMRVRLDDADIDVLDEGSGSPIVLLHGFPLAKELWDDQASVLHRRARVVRLDLRGLGASRDGPGPYLMEQLAGDVAGVLDALGIARAIVVGHSLGTYVTYAFFRMFEERVAGLGLVCGRATADTPEVMSRRHALANRVESDGTGPLLDEYLPRLFAATTYERNAEIVERARAMIVGTDPLGAAAVVRGMAARVAAEDLFEAMSVPVTIVAGRADALVPVCEQEATAQRITGAQLVVLESGHMPQWEAPSALSEALSRLLDAAEGGA